MKDRWDIFAFAIIFIVITLPSIPPLASGDKLNFNDDFLQYASRYEAVRKSLFEHHAFPLRSHWFGGGYPTLGDPEDSTLNPLVLFAVLLGTVKGLKVIGYLSLLTGGLSAYALTRYVLGYTRWGSLYAGLIFGTSLFVPSRIADGNYNEGYAAFVPLCMLLMGLACRRKKVALLILPFVFYIMLSDGKLNALMAIFYMGIFCLLDVVPAFSTFTDGAKKVDIRPVKILALVLVVTFMIGMVRFLPALELINARGGLKNMDLAFRPKTYEPGGIFAYTFQQLWQEAVGRSEHHNLVTIGWVPLALFAISLIFWRKTLPWGVSSLLFVWLILAHNAPVDLLKSLWNLPIFSTIYRPYKYFSFQIVLTLAIASGQSFWILRKLPYRWLEHICAVILIVAGVWFLYPRMAEVQRNTYDFDLPAEILVQEKDFFNIQGKGLNRNRKEPPRSVTYYNLLRDIGTIDWYTGIPVDENAIPRYFVGKNNNYIPNPEYQGEVSFLGVEDAIELRNPLPTVEAQFAGMAGLWHFDLVQGNLAIDSSGKGNDGRLMGVRHSDLVCGRFGNAFMFDGGNWVDIGPDPALKLDGSYTLSAWVKPFDIPYNMERFILDTDFWRSGSRYSLVLHRGYIRFMHQDDGTSFTAQVPYAEVSFQRNRWHHIVGVFDQTHMRLYVDGALRAVERYTRKSKFREDVSIRIGGRTDPPGRECFKGLIDEVAIWDKALTPEEVARIWSIGSTEQLPSFEESMAKAEFQPNSIIAQVHIETPGILVVNQNYHRDWHTDRGELFDRDGLLAIRLHEAGSYTIHVRYIPRSFYTGLAISILSLAVLAFVCWAYRTGRLLNWSRYASPIPRFISKATLWLID